MTTYDAAMVIVVVLGLARGAWRGFTWQMASITSLVLGYTAAHTWSARIAFYLPGEPEVQRILAMSIVYILVSGGIFGIAWMIRGTLRKLRFEAYDRHLGMLLGGLEGAGVGMLATLFVVSLAPATRQPIFSSTTGRVVGTVMNNLGPVLPGEFRKVLAAHWDGSFSKALAADHADTEAAGTASTAGAARGLDELQLPPLHEAESEDGSSALPALVSPADEDRAVKRASGSLHSESSSAPDWPQGNAGLDGVIEEGRQEVEQAVSEAIDRHMHRIGGLKPATSTGPK